jgi:hypothetical protein
MVQSLPFAKRWKDNYRFADQPPTIGPGTSVLCALFVKMTSKATYRQ